MYNLSISTRNRLVLLIERMRIAILWKVSEAAKSQLAAGS
jgi:hypothetical protein